MDSFPLPRARHCRHGSRYAVYAHTHLYALAARVCNVFISRSRWVDPETSGRRLRGVRKKTQKVYWQEIYYSEKRQREKNRERRRENVSSRRSIISVCGNYCSVGWKTQVVASAAAPPANLWMRSRTSPRSSLNLPDGRAQRNSQINTRTQTKTNKQIKVLKTFRFATQEAVNSALFIHSVFPIASTSLICRFCSVTVELKLM